MDEDLQETDTKSTKSSIGFLSIGINYPQVNINCPKTGHIFSCIDTGYTKIDTNHPSVDTGFSKTDTNIRSNSICFTSAVTHFLQTDTDCLPTGIKNQTSERKKRRSLFNNNSTHTHKMPFDAFIRILQLKKNLIMSNKVLTGFPAYSDADLETKTQFIIQNMTDNAVFPTPVPALEAVQAAFTEFQSAVTAFAAGGLGTKDMRDQKKTALIQLLNTLALYVQGASNGVVSAMASSGFSVSKTPAPVGILSKPENFKATAMEGEMVKLNLKALHGAHSYQYEYRVVNADSWIIVVHTQSNLLLTDLTAGAQYEFRVAGVGYDPSRVYSDIVRSYIL